MLNETFFYNFQTLCLKVSFHCSLSSKQEKLTFRTFFSHDLPKDRAEPIWVWELGHFELWQTKCFSTDKKLFHFDAMPLCVSSIKSFISGLSSRQLKEILRSSFLTPNFILLKNTQRGTNTVFENSLNCLTKDTILKMSH